MGPSLRISELESWCRSRGVSEADESQLRAVFKERDRFELDLLRVHDALHRECDGTADLPAEIRRLRASNEGIAASLETQVEAARKDERAERDGAVAEAAALRRERDVARAEWAAAAAKAAGTTAAIPEIVNQSVAREREAIVAIARNLLGDGNQGDAVVRAIRARGGTKS